MFISGVARGSGWQKIGAFVNLGAYYLVGIPIAAVLAFVFQLKGKGLLIGLATGSFVQAALLALKIVFTDWGKQVLNIQLFFCIRLLYFYFLALAASLYCFFFLKSNMGSLLFYKMSKIIGMRIEYMFSNLGQKNIFSIQHST